MRKPFVPGHVRGAGTVLDRNIQALQEHREKVEATASGQERLADAITRFAGSMTSVYIHAAVFGGWIVWNSGFIPGLTLFDETLVKLATFASVEAIFLSTFIMISQNRAAEMADLRANLELQIGLLAEHEVTRLITLTKAIAHKLDVEEANDAELSELQHNVAPERVLNTLQQAKTDTGTAR